MKVSEAERPDAGVPAETGRASRLLVVDWVAVVYLAVTGLLAAAAGTAVGLVVAAGHLAVAGVILRWAPAVQPRWEMPATTLSGHAYRFFRAAYPVVLTPLLYSEVSLLNGLLVPGYLDATVQEWESALFGVQLSMEAARWLPSRWLSELFHVGYASYYVIVPGAAVAVYLSAGGRDLHRLGVATALAFFGCYVIFMLVPVQGPRYLFPALTGTPAESVLYEPLHWFLERGSSRGAAFPSSHVAAALASWLASRRAAPRWFRWSAPFVWLLALGTVYGRFHYGVDALAGLAMGAGAWLLTPILLRAGSEPETPDAAPPAERGTGGETDPVTEPRPDPGGRATGAGA